MALGNNSYYQLFPVTKITITIHFLDISFGAKCNARSRLKDRQIKPLTFFFRRLVYQLLWASLIFWTRPMSINHSNSKFECFGRRKYGGWVSGSVLFPIIINIRIMFNLKKRIENFNFTKEVYPTWSLLAVSSKVLTQVLQPLRRENWESTLGNFFSGSSFSSFRLRVFHCTNSKHFPKWLWVDSLYSYRQLDFMCFKS